MVHFRGPVGSIEGPWLVLDPMEVRSCVPRVPWNVFFVAYHAKIRTIQMILGWMMIAPLPTLNSFENTLR